MPTVEQSVDVNVDASTAYDQWTQFETFPQWMEGVASIEQTDDGHLHWVAKVRNEFATVKDETREWDARITEQIHDKRISWESVGGKPDEKPNTGAATFVPLGDAACRVTFRMFWEPEGGLETPTQVLDAVNHVVAADLARFKDLIEARGAANSAHGEKPLRASTG